MMHGDISNVSGYTIAFRYENNVVLLKQGFINKLTSTFKGTNVDTDYSVVKAMEYVYRSTPYSCDLVIERCNYTDKVREFILNSLPNSRVVLIDKDIEITHRIKMGDIDLYIDNDENRRNLINSQYAIPLRDMNKFMKRGRAK